MTLPLIVSRQNREFAQKDKAMLTLLINRPELLNLSITFLNILPSLKKKSLNMDPIKNILLTYKESMNAPSNALNIKITKILHDIQVCQD